jgi:hypothetical protein
MAYGLAANAGGGNRPSLIAYFPSMCVRSDGFCYEQLIYQCLIFFVYGEKTSRGRGVRAFQLLLRSCGVQTPPRKNAKKKDPVGSGGNMLSLRNFVLK